MLGGGEKVWEKILEELRGGLGEKEGNAVVRPSLV